MRGSHLTVLALVVAIGLSACGRLNVGSNSNPNPDAGAPGGASQNPARDEAVRGENIFTLFRPPPAENVTKVNRYLWTATLEVLDFLPVQSIDPFTGVIVTGFGTPPGGRSSYRATILIDDPALDARSLNVSLQTRSGPASASTVRAVEDAILTRARQLRVGDSRL